MGRWLCAVVAIAACGGDRAANRAALEETESKLAALESCVAGKQAPDFATAFALVLDGTPAKPLTCFDPAFTAATGAVIALAKKMGKPVPKLHVTIDRVDLDHAAELCADLMELTEETNALAKELGEKPRGTPACDVEPLRVGFTQAPGSLAGGHPSLEVADGALLVAMDDRWPDLDDSFPRLGRMADHEWDLRDAPKLMHRWAWPAAGPIAITRLVKGQRTLMLEDGKGGWIAGARTPTEAVTTILRAGDHVAVVGLEKKDSPTTSVRRSADGGKTLGPPIALFTGKDRVATARLRADGTVIALAGTPGTRVAEAVRLAPDATVKAVTTLTWPETIEIANRISVCDAGATYWALDRGHVIVSTDAGVSWEPLALDKPFAYAQIACSSTKLAVWTRADDHHRELRMCTAKGCDEPLVIPFEADNLAGFALEPAAELWLATRHGEKEAFVVTANKIGPSLARTRVMVAKPWSSGEGAVHDGKAFVLMHAGY